MFFVSYIVSILFIPIVVFFGLKYTARSHMREKARLIGNYIREKIVCKEKMSSVQNIIDNYLSPYLIKQVISLLDIINGFLEGITNKDKLIKIYNVKSNETQTDEINYNNNFILSIPEETETENIIKLEPETEFIRHNLGSYSDSSDSDSENDIKNMKNIKNIESEISNKSISFTNTINIKDISESESESETESSDSESSDNLVTNRFADSTVVSFLKNNKKIIKTTKPIVVRDGDKLKISIIKKN